VVISVRVRVRRASLAALTDGIDCHHLRLDRLPGGPCGPDDEPIFDVYLETRQDVPSGVPARDAPHSEGFRPARSGFGALSPTSEEA
jgi:hypothetical protein